MRRGDGPGDGRRCARLRVAAARRSGADVRRGVVPQRDARGGRRPPVDDPRRPVVLELQRDRVPRPRGPAAVRGLPGRLPARRRTARRRREPGGGARRRQRRRGDRRGRAHGGRRRRAPRRRCRRWRCAPWPGWRSCRCRPTGSSPARSSASRCSARSWSGCSPRCCTTGAPAGGGRGAWRSPRRAGSCASSGHLSRSSSGSSTAGATEDGRGRRCGRRPVRFRRCSMWRGRTRSGGGHTAGWRGLDGSDVGLFARSVGGWFDARKETSVWCTSDTPGRRGGPGRSRWCGCWPVWSRSPAWPASAGVGCPSHWSWRWRPR